MNRNRLLIGISAAALAAGVAAAPAAAQTGNTTGGNCPSTGTVAATPGGTCTIDNNAIGNDRNFAFISQVGEGNVAVIRQNGDDNTAIIEQNGSFNDSQILQNGDDHFADNDQTGNSNFSRISQGDEENSTTVIQVSSGVGATANNAARNSSTVWQGTATDGTGSANSNLGENNVARVNQNGSRLLSTIVQSREAAINLTGFGRVGYNVEGVTTPPFPNTTANRTSRVPADDNSATVTQTGSGSESRIYQIARGNIARVNMSGGGSNTSTLARQNGILIVQDNDWYRQNADGTFTGAQTSGTTQPFPDANNNPLTGNLVDAVISGQQNRSFVNQSGVLNTMLLTMSGGGSDPASAATANSSGGTLPANRIQGNEVDVTQFGRNNTAAYSNGLSAQGNQARIDQGNLTYDTFFSPFTEAMLARAHTAFVWQRGILDRSNILQDNNSNGPGGATQFGSYADVSQITLNSTSTVRQLGTNSATVSQARNRDGTGGDNRTNVNQEDLGDIGGTTPGSGPFDPAPTPGSTAARNTVAVSQAGIANNTQIDQTAVNATAIVWQQLGSRGNYAEVEQGTGGQTSSQAGPTGVNGGFLAADVPAGSANTGANAHTLTADVTQSGRGSTARVRQDGQNLSLLATQAGTAVNTSGVAIDSANVLQVSQINALNSATVSQNGFGLNATVDQRGSGAVGSDNVTRRNLVTIQQTGDNHNAVARQLANVGPSGPDSPAGTSPAAGDASQPAVFTFARAAGRQSAEIQIIQTGSTNLTNTSTADDDGNDAVVEQQGKGQFARIEQHGQNNNAGILQGPNATNAVAVIYQEGRGNSYFITQDSPGQYFAIRQVGNNNASTQEISSAPNSGSPGTGAPTSTGAGQPVGFFPF